jgi:hypothetical protein
MRIHDIRVLTTSVFCVSIASMTGMGCGSALKTAPPADGGARDLGADTTTVDGSAGDSPALPEVARLDAQVDSAAPDVGVDSSKTDAADTAVDSSRTDAADAGVNPTEPDAGSGDAALDGQSSSDSATTVDSGGPDTGYKRELTQAIISLVFKNPSMDTVYLRTECWLPFQVTDEATGTVYENKIFCACDCANSSCVGGLACGACPPPSGIAVATGKSLTGTWVAQTSTLLQKSGTAGSYQCVAHSPLLTGRYRVSIAVYSSAADAAAMLNATTATTSFDLTTTDATVDVPLR